MTSCDRVSNQNRSKDTPTEATRSKEDPQGLESLSTLAVCRDSGGGGGKVPLTHLRGEGPGGVVSASGTPSPAEGPPNFEGGVVGSPGPGPPQPEGPPWGLYYYYSPAP